MDTVTFLSTLTPRNGLLCIAALRLDDPDRYDHFFTETDEEAARIALELDANKRTVYYALASYDPDKIAAEKHNGRGLWYTGRKQINVQAIKVIPFDIDCGPGKPYATAEDGLAALRQFQADTCLDNAWIVSSGNGLHAYIELAEELTRDEWQPRAERVKAICLNWGLQIDPKPTANAAAVLRPVGTHHRKDPANPRPVTLLEEGTPWPVADLDDQLQAVMDAWGVAEPKVYEASSVEGGLNSELWSGGTGPTERPPSYLHKIRPRCPALDHVWNLHGNVPEPLWHATVCLAKNAEDCADFIHDLSNGHPDYTPEETEQKLELARKSGTGPTTCKNFAQHLPAICQGCKHRGKVSSPILLGEEVPEMQVQQPVAPPTAAQAALQQAGMAPVAAAAPSMQSLTFPPGYRMAPHKGVPALWVHTGEDEDGNPQWVPFSTTIFYGEERIKTEGASEMRIRMWEKVNPDGTPKVWKDFDMSCTLIGQGGPSLLGALGGKEIAAMHPRQSMELTAYLQAWMNKLLADKDAINQYKCFGWHGEDFLAGDTLITPTGSQPVLLSGMAKFLSPHLQPRGSLEEWKRIIHRAYDHVGQEHFQFLVAIGFAAPLFSMFRDYGGITVFAHSEGSGAGKTTAQRAALSVWGDPNELMLSEGKVTANSLWAWMGALHHLPILFDELTNQSAAAAADVVFSASSGRQKQRLGPDGTPRTNNSNWQTILMANGNNLLTEKLSANRANAEAEMVRTFEFSCPNNSPLSVNEAAELFPLLVDNCGHAGVLFASYVTANREKVQNTLLRMQQHINTEARIAQKERYWSAMMASVLTATAVCNRLGLLRFDIGRLKLWLYDKVASNRVQRDAAVQSPTDQFGRMLAEIWSGVLVTYGEGDLRKGEPAFFPDGTVLPRGQLTGRVILPHAKEDKGKAGVLMLNVASVTEWTQKHKVSRAEMFNALVAAGIADREQIRYTLGRGTTQFGSTSSQVLCWRVNLHALEAKLGGVHSGLITRLSAIEGGRQGDDDVHRSQQGH